MDWAERMLENLEAFYGQRYDRQHWPKYLEALRQQPEDLAQEVFNLLVRTEKRLPPVAVVVQAFGRVQEAEESTREAQRSRPMTDEEVARYRALMEYQNRMAPVYEQPDLYERYLVIMLQVKAGKMTPEAARQAREALLREAMARRERSAATVAAGSEADVEPPF